MRKDPFRFHDKHFDVRTVFGNDWFALKAEAFARFFGTPVFLMLQTTIVTIWIILNVFGFTHFDMYPFILLNLAFSLQAAYAAPLILLAQTRQADRDKVHSEADAKHREEIAVASEQRSLLTVRQMEMMSELLQLNTELTRKIESLTVEVHTELKKTTVSTS